MQKVTTFWWNIERDENFSKKEISNFARLQIQSIPTTTEDLSLAVNQTSATTKTPENLINLKVLQSQVVNSNYYQKILTAR